MIRVAIICETEQDRGSIPAILSFRNGFQIVGTGRGGYDALRCASVLYPDIIVMDILLSDISGAELAPLIKSRSPETKLIALYSHNEIDRMSGAFRAGIAGFLFKPTDMNKLPEACKTVLYGGYYFSAPVIQHIIAGSAGGEQAILYSPVCFILEQISPVARRIINYVALGYTDKEIADNLHMAAGTIRNMLAVVKRKSGLKNRTHIVSCAHLCGLITKTSDMFLEIDNGGHGHI